MKTKQFYLICFFSLLCCLAFGQITVFPYLCGFETGPDGTDIVGTEPNWDGSDQWEYDDYTPNSGTYCANSTISTTGDNSRNLYVNLDFSNETGIKPSFYYKSTNQNTLVQVVGMVNETDWIILKDWFTPVAEIWTLVDYTELSNLSEFDNESSCRFGIRAKKNGGNATLRLDDFHILTDNSDIWDVDATTTDWNTAGNWEGGTVPAATTNVVIPTDAANYPILSADGSCNNINIQSVAELSINSGQTLNVNGNFTIESDATGTGSFLNEGSLNMVSKGSIIFQRYIEAWTTQEDGWHLIATPVNSFTVAGSDFVPGNNDDLFYWSESDNLWMNYKVSSFDFSNGHGYLCAYETTDTKEFSGTFNASDIGFTDLSVGSGSGWHLLGNPFPCALKWNDGNWGLSGIENTAQVYNESAGNYLALSANDIIPASQGFFVKATASTNSITIPITARTHDNTSFYKSIMEDNPQITMKVTSDETDFYDINKIRMLSGASLNYDPAYDGHKMFGQQSAPQLYSISTDGEELSLNAISTEMSQTLQLGFEAGVDGTYHIFMEEFFGFDTTSIILLEDLKEDLLFTLDQDTTYDFNALTTDNPERFLLHFVDVTAVEQVQDQGAITALYKSGNIILINHSDEIKQARVELIALTGRKLKSWQIQLQAINSIQVDLYPAVYILRVTTDCHYTTKILVQQ